MSETQRMMNIIHENHLKEKVKKISYKKMKKITMFEKIILFMITTLSFFGLMYLIALIENLNF